MTVCNRGTPGAVSLPRQWLARLVQLYPQGSGFFVRELWEGFSLGTDLEFHSEGWVRVQYLPWRGDTGTERPIIIINTSH